MDSIALSKLGATVVGVDFSEMAIDKANELAKVTKTNASFICSDIYSLPQVLNEKFDIVFTSYGTIGWLPDLNKWANLIQHFLKVDGEFIMADFHPFIWMWNNDFEKIEYNYFNTEPIIETLEGTYANKNSEIKETEIGWNHPVSEILNALISNGLNIKEFNEFNYSPYNCFNNTFEIAPNKFQIKSLGDKMPYVYALKAVK